jgi:hypothetical protein
MPIQANSSLNKIDGNFISPEMPTEQNVGPKPPTVRFEMEALLAGARSTLSFVALIGRVFGDVDWDGTFVWLSRLMRGLSLGRCSAFRARILR